MGKKVREYKSGDFIFAKVKGYPAWPARVQRLNGKKYFVYFYGTGETANLPPNMIFDYAENKDKFLTKTQKRRDFNDGVKQIEYDFANNVPLEDVIGAPPEVAAEVPANETGNDSAINDMDETADTTANDTADDTIANTTQNDAPVEDSDENGALVIDEGKAPKKKSKADAAKTPAKETPKAKEPKTPRGKAKKDDKDKSDDVEEERRDEEVVSRSGRKIRPKRFVDEHIEESLPSPAPKKRRGASPSVEKDKPEPKDKNINSFNAVTQSELEDLKQPFKPEDADKENILIAYLPTGKYVGIKLFQSRPTSFKNESTRLQWDKQAASNAITLKMQLERDHIPALSIQGQLVMDLNLTDEEKATLDKERETEAKKSRVEFLKTEMQLIDLDSKIKVCLSIEKAETEECLKLMDEMSELEVKPLMLMKHPTCLETLKRLRSYVGNTPSWDMSEEAALTFSRQAHRIRKLADELFMSMQELFTTPDGLTFWEFYLERVEHFKRNTAHLTSSEILELVHEPLEMSHPTSHTMRAAIDAANQEAQDDETPKKKGTAAKQTPRKAATTPAKGKRQSTRKQPEEKSLESDSTEPEDVDMNAGQNAEEPETTAPEPDETAADANKETDAQASDKESDASHEVVKTKDTKQKNKKGLRNADKIAKEAEKNTKEAEKNTKEAEKNAKEAENNAEEPEDNAKEVETNANETENSKVDENISEDAEDSTNIAESSTKDTENNVESTTKDTESTTKETEKPKETETVSKKSPKKGSKESSPKVDKNSKETDKNAVDADKSTDEPENITEVAQSAEPEASGDKDPKDAKTPIKKGDKGGKDNGKTGKDEKSGKDSGKSVKDDKTGKDSGKSGKDDKSGKDSGKSGKDGEKSGKDSDKNAKNKESEKRKADDDKADEKREESSEPRAKRSRETRESKKTDAPPPRSPTKRKSKH